jgi:hypothetical protein
VNMVINLRVPLNAGKFLSSCTMGGFSRRTRLHGVTSLLYKHVFTWRHDTGQRITTIQLDGVQYFISRMNPYSPELNYFLAYQYCRSIGLQLASFESKEKADSMTQYLLNAGK